MILDEIQFENKIATGNVNICQRKTSENFSTLNDSPYIKKKQTKKKQNQKTFSCI